MVAQDCQNAVIYSSMDKGVIITAGVFVALNLCWIWRLTENKKVYQRQLREEREWIRKLEGEHNRDQEVLVSLLESDDYPLSGDLLFLTPDETTVRLTDIVDEKPRLVLYLADNHCDSCVEQIIFGIKKTITDIGVSNLMIFYSAQDLSSAKRLKSESILPEIRFYRIFMGKLSIPAINSGVPFLFIIDSSLKMQAPLLIFPTMEEWAGTYIRLMALKYLSQKQTK